MKSASSYCNCFRSGSRSVFALSASLCSALLLAAPAQAQEVSYNFVPTTGNWSTAANWDQNAVPDSITTARAVIGSGKTANVDGSYSTGYLYIGSNSHLSLSGSGSVLNVGNIGSSQTGVGIASGNGKITVQDGASLSVAGTFVIGAGVSGSLASPSLNITNASVSLGNLQFNGSGPNVLTQLVLNEGADLALNFIYSGTTTNNALIFNAGAGGFGKMTVANFDPHKIGALEINALDFTGIGSFTLIDTSRWNSDFASITFNGASYTLGTDVLYNGLTWNIRQNSQGLVLTSIPEASTVVLLLPLAAGALLLCRRRRAAR